VKEVLLVTGSSGIAAATARMWATENPVFVVGINKEEGRSLTTELGEAGFDAADVRDQYAGAQGLLDMTETGQTIADMLGLNGTCTQE
jgi:NADP-dependent 3-hydroxy acid dehydrogenase YdfG